LTCLSADDIPGQINFHLLLAFSHGLSDMLNHFSTYVPGTHAFAPFCLYDLIAISRPATWSFILPRDAMVAQLMLSPCVCLSVRLSEFYQGPSEVSQSFLGHLYIITHLTFNHHMLSIHTTTQYTV